MKTKPGYLFRVRYAIADFKAAQGPREAVAKFQDLLEAMCNIDDLEEIEGVCADLDHLLEIEYPTREAKLATADDVAEIKAKLNELSVGVNAIQLGEARRGNHRPSSLDLLDAQERVLNELGGRERQCDFLRGRLAAAEAELDRAWAARDALRTALDTIANVGANPAFTVQDLGEVARTVLAEAAAAGAGAGGTLDPRLQHPISSYDLSIRCQHHLEDCGVKTIADLVRMSHKDLSRTHRFSARSLKEIKVLLGDLGLRLGMTAAETGGGR